MLNRHASIFQFFTSKMADSAKLSESLGDDIMQNINTARKWKPLAPTCVEYEEGDMIGYVMAWLSMVPIFLVISFFPLILLRRDLHTMSFLIGIIANECCNWVVKHIVQQPRPSSGKIVAVAYGMPSSHCQCMWFFATYLTLFIFIRIYRHFTMIEEIWKYVVSLASFTLAFLVCASRIYLMYHTTAQVVCGSVLGATNAVLWFLIVNYVFTPFFPCIASHPIGEFFMVRDSTLIPHVLWFEYTSTRTEARSRQRKFTSKKSM